MSYLAGRLDRVLRRSLRAALRPQALSVAEYTALTVLRHDEGLTNAQLARRSLITPQAMNEVLAALDRRGLVVRRAGRGRAIGTSLTPAARAALSECDPAVDALEREMLAGLTRSEVDQLRKALGSCSRRLEDAAAW